MTRTRQFLLAFAALCIGGGWFTYQHYFSLDHIHFKPSQHDAFMTDVEYLRYDEQGQLNKRLFTPLAIHHAATDGMTLHKPWLILYEDQKPEWTITADYGISQNRNKRIDLHDHVILKRAATPTRPSSTITTTTLTLHPQARTAHTDAAVTLRQADSTLHATGLDTDFGHQSVKLLSESTGDYVYHRH